MGCASAKPESHTKKPALNQNSGVKNSTNLNAVKENPQIKNEQKTFQKDNYLPTPPVISNQINSQASPVKSNLEDLQKNSTLTKKEVQQTVLAQQSEAHQRLNQQIKEVKKESTLQTVTPIKEINASSQKKSILLSVIPQQTEESALTKKPHIEIAGLKVEEKHDEIKNSARDSLLNSFPGLNENFQVSKISKNQSAEKIQNLSAQKVQQVNRSHEKSIESHGLTASQIKINVLDIHQSKMRDSSLRSDQFTALAEEQFDLNCSFDPNTLVVDMNKVAW